jgi:gamma-glutamylcyclotransferase (GGCT)/AIG2-like uncharacterized protein YtfP
MPPALVFVYGTLRKGGVRALPSLYPGAPDHGDGVITGTLFDFGAYPGLQLGGADAADVAGEVYGVTDEILAALDQIEEFRPAAPADSFYTRERVTVRMRAGGVRECWVYVFNPARFDARDRIASGDWIAHAAQKMQNGPLPPEAWPDGAPIKSVVRYTLLLHGIELGEVVAADIDAAANKGRFEAVAKTDQPDLRAHAAAYLDFARAADRIARESNYGDAFTAFLEANRGRFDDLARGGWQLAHPERGTHDILVPYFPASGEIIFRWARPGTMVI